MLFLTVFNNKIYFLMFDIDPCMYVCRVKWTWLVKIIYYFLLKKQNKIQQLNFLRLKIYIF